MTPLEALPLLLWGIPIVFFASFVVYDGVVALQRRSWDRRAKRLLASVDERLAVRAARAILEDAEVAFLDSCWELPTAPEPR